MYYAPQLEDTMQIYLQLQKKGKFNVRFNLYGYRSIKKYQMPSLHQTLVLKYYSTLIPSFSVNYLTDITYHGLPDPALRHEYQKSLSSVPVE